MSKKPDHAKANRIKNILAAKYNHKTGYLGHAELELYPFDRAIDFIAIGFQ